MRFIPNGPWLPDELLTARDAGHVLFFCGAGVSQADANLPNFAVLAERVLTLIGSALDSPARRLFNASRKFEKSTKLTGLVATDRIFGMLEREFEASEVREAVAMALQPFPGYSLNAHRTLLDLSSIGGAPPRLVTTNFDRLFEECDPSLDSFNPPHLPDPRRPNDFRGIIHLHGRVDEHYRRACDDEFVLSSADFGHAYLSDGWATRYIQSLLQRFHIVFVGYSADDPPVQYLLEALNRFARPSHNLYAFQSGNARQATDQWSHKGVTPISYDSADHHASLWMTLTEWAERARDVEGWRGRLLATAARGPQSMKPYERGMIAHLAKTASGAGAIAGSKTALPADWLFVFDRSVRYGRPTRLGASESEPPFDPFDAYGLDDDELPAPVDPNDFFKKRDIPEGAWDGLVPTSSDLENFPVSSIAGIRNRSDRDTKLSQRLASMAWWIRKVAHQPAALWWAAGQPALHNQLQSDIEWSLRREAERYLPQIRRGWRMLFASWEGKQHAIDTDRYAIQDAAEREGWTSSVVREAVSLYRPRVSVERSYGTNGSIPDEEVALELVLSIKVEYPRPHISFAFPDEVLAYAVTLFRRQLEDAVILEAEVTGHDRVYLDSIRADDGEVPAEDAYALTGHAVTFTNLVSRLAKFDRTAARREVESWSSPDPVFTRLRIWTFGRSDLTTPEEAGTGFLTLDAEAFWEPDHERETLYALRDRWASLPLSIRRGIEVRLRTEDYPWAHEHEEREALIAHNRLSRMHWLASHGVTFSFDLESETSSLVRKAPDWTKQSVRYKAQPHVGKARTLTTDVDASELKDTPIGKILETVENLSRYRFDAPVIRQPFRGLAETHPSRALAALKDAARRGDFAAWAWGDLLSSNGRTSRTRVLAAIGARLAKLETNRLLEIARESVDWLNECCDALYLHYPSVCDLVSTALLVALRHDPGRHKMDVPDRRWVDEALNSSAGRMVETLFAFPSLKKLGPNDGLSDAWLEKLERTLILHADNRRYAIVMIASRISWLYHIDPHWVETRLLKISARQDADAAAFWSGFLWRAGALHPSLYRKLKRPLIALARASSVRKDQANSLAAMLLLGWLERVDMANHEQTISDVELREVLIHTGDDLRSWILWHLRQFANRPEVWSVENASTFLERVWPRQRTVRTAGMSGKLVDLALSLPNQFPEIATAILPRLVPIEGDSLMLYRANINDKILVEFPRSLLSILSVVLGPDPSTWPYGTGEILTELAQQPDTRDDPSLAILIRSFQAR